MAQGRWPCCGLGSHGSSSRGGGSSRGRSYRLVNEVDNVPLDDVARSAPLGDDIDLVAQPNEDATKTLASRRHPQGPNGPHALRAEIPCNSLFHLVIGR